MIKLIATDMDGTLLSDEKNVNPEIYNTIREMKEKGIYFAAASGRQLSSIEGYFAPVQDDVLYLAENGAHISYRGKEMFSDAMDMKTVHELIDNVRNIKDSMIMLCGKNKAYADDIRTVKMMRQDIFKYNIELVDDLKDVKEDVLKVSMVDMTDFKETTLKIMESLFKDRLYMAVSGFNCLDFMNKGAGKGTALRFIQKQLGISKAETVVFGDNYNDVDMFDEAYYSYAMSNADESVRKRARFIAGNNNEDMVLKTIERLI